MIPECVRVAHIVKLVSDASAEADALRAIKEAEAEMNSGVSFEELADRVSDDQAPGGQLGWIRVGQLPREFDDVAFAIPAGSVSRVFRGGAGVDV